MIQLLMQYFRKGLVVADKKRKCLLNKIKYKWCAADTDKRP